MKNIFYILTILILNQYAFSADKGNGSTILNSQLQETHSAFTIQTVEYNKNLIYRFLNCIPKIKHRIFPDKNLSEIKPLKIEKTTYEQAIDAYKKAQKYSNEELGDSNLFLIEQLLKEAIDLGHKHAKYELGMLYEELSYTDYDYISKALNCFKESAELGNTYSQYKLAQYYFDGIETPRNDMLAFQWAFTAANNHHPSAQYLLAACYESGLGTEKNVNEAFKWLQSAADNDHVMSQYRLALYFLQGSGSHKNRKNGIKWLTIAKNNGHGGASYYLESIQAVQKKDLQSLQNDTFNYNAHQWIESDTT